VGGLAAVALDRIVGHAHGRQALIADTVHRAVSDLFAGSIVAVEVSCEDFADPAPLRAVVPKDCDVHLLDGLPSGACRLRLRMGEVDLDLQGQADRLRAVLDPARGSVR
jgi:type III secretion protein L